MSVLVDSSVWIDHLNKSETVLMEMLEFSLVDTHAYIVGELACGLVRDRNEFFNFLTGLSYVTKVEDAELLHFIARNNLYGKGLGLVDMHILASCCVDGILLWTRDKRLKAAAEGLGITCMK